MQALVLSMVMCCCTLFASASNFNSLDTFRLTSKNGKLVHLGISYRNAVRFELQAPTAELLLQPIAYASIGYRIGQVRTKKLPELFRDSRGLLQGIIFRANLPNGKGTDYYIEYARTEGNLSFSVDEYRAESSIDPRFQIITSRSGDVAFRQNHFQFGGRRLFARNFFIDVSIGVVMERFIFRSVGLVGPFENEEPSILSGRPALSVNEWHDNVGLRLGLSVGVRF